MENKQFNDTMELTFAKSKAKNGKSILFDRPHISRDKNMISEDQYIHQLQNLQEQNANLLRLVEMRNKELVEEAESNNKYISILAHDLRSPFNSILGTLELVLENLEDNDINELKNYIHIAINSTNNTLNLLDNLLVWIVPQLQGESFNPVKIDLHGLLLEEIKNITTMADLKQITLKQSIAEDLKVTADLQMVKAILRNLISNAIKYTRNNGTITLSALENGCNVEIAIEDNGVGISEAVQKDLFKRNSNSSTDSRNKNGTGLGLHICKDFVEMHGGNIWLESQPGKGSKFTLTLPHYL